MSNIPDKRIIKKMGFLKDQDGIMNRYFREGEAWKEHLQRSRDFILESFRDASIKTVAVLGSGWLLDLPIEEMSNRFEKILLLDIHHPVQVRHRIETLDNVMLQETDLSGGGIRYCYELRKHLRKKHKDPYPQASLSEFRPAIPDLLFEPDAFISLNILSQLHYFLLDYLEENKYFQQSETDHFSKVIQQFHIDWITRKPACLITDIREINTDNTGTQSFKPLLSIRLTKEKRMEQWKWQFDTAKTYRPGMSTEMEVKALEW